MSDLNFEEEAKILTEGFEDAEGNDGSDAPIIDGATIDAAWPEGSNEAVEVDAEERIDGTQAEDGEPVVTYEAPVQEEPVVESICSKRAASRAAKELARQTRLKEQTDTIRYQNEQKAKLDSK